MSDVDRVREELGLPIDKAVPPLFPPKAETEAPLIPPVPQAVDPLREELGLQTSPMYERSRGPVPEAPAADEPTMNLMRLLASSPDPVAEMSRINATQYIAKTFNMDPAKTYANLEELSQYWLGKVAPAPVFAQSLRDAWDNGMKNYDLSKLALQLRERGGEDALLVKQITELEATMVPLQEIPRPWIKNALLWAMESSPLMAQSFLRGGIWGAGAGAAAGLALHGTPMGLAAAGISQGMSVPAITLAMASVGFAVGSTKDMMDSMRGLAYWRMRKQQVPHNIAGPLSDIEGMIEGGIESLGQVLLGVKLPGLTPALKSAGTLVANKMMATGVMGAIATRLAGQAIGGALGEGIENPLQEATAIFTDMMARELSKRQDVVTAIKPISAQEAAQRIGESFFQGLSAGLVFGVAGWPGGLRADITQLTTIRDLAKRMPTRLGFINSVVRADYLLEGTGASEGAWRTYLGKVWDQQHPGKAAAAAVTPEAAAQVTPGGAPIAAEAAVPTRGPEGRIYTEIETRTRTRKGVTGLLKAGDPATGARYGYVIFETTEKGIYIEDVINETASDLRREMVLDLMARYPGQEVEWNPTDELDVALKEDLVATNPLGSERGLQRFEVARPEAQATAQQELTRGLFVERMGALFNATTPEQAELYGKLADTFAQVSGQSTQDWLRQYISAEVAEVTPETTAELKERTGIAATRFRVGEHFISPLTVDQFKGQVRAVFTALSKADFHHGVHEFFHAVERLALSPEQVSKFETALGKLRQTWTAQDIEGLADRFEDYLATGKAPTEELRSVFQQIAAALKAVLSFIRERLGKDPEFLSPEFQAAYDSLLAKPRSGLAQAAEPAPPAAPAAAVEVSQVEEGLPPSTEGAASIISPSAVPPVEIELSRITLSAEVPNFKELADKRGIIEALKGEEYVKVGIPPIVLWERMDGRLEVITGRHRLDLAQRLKLPTILSQIVREADGFTAAMAMTFDAEANIRDGQGSVRDYANYFRNTEITEEQASRRGLLDRHKGRTGYALGRYAADGLYSLFRNDQISEAKAAAIAAASLGDERLQSLGITKAKKLSADELGNFLALARQTVTTSAGVQADMFGFDDSLIREGELIAKAVSSKKAELLQERQALSSAIRLSRGAQAKIVEKYGFKAGDTAAIQDRVDVLGAELETWEHWTQDPEKMREARQLAGLPVAAPAAGPALMHPEEGEGPFELIPFDDKLLREKAPDVQPIFDFAEKQEIRLADWEKTKEGWKHVSGAMADKQTTLILNRLKDDADNLSLFHRDLDLQKRFNEAAVEIFGVTDNPKYASWILSDGRMLDFSWEKHKALGVAKYHERIGHVGIADVVGKIWTDKATRPGAYEGAWQAGALRMDVGLLGELAIQGTMIPTGEQMNTIEYLLTGKEMALLEFSQTMGPEFHHGGGIVEDIRTIGWENLSNPTMGDVRRFYLKMAQAIAPKLTYIIDRLEVRANAGRFEVWAHNSNTDEWKYYLAYEDEKLARRYVDEHNALRARALFHTDDELLYKSLQVVNAKMKGPMPASQLRSMLLGNGVKADEMKWTGLDDFLAEERKISPQEVREYIAANAVRIKEVRYTETLNIWDADQRPEGGVQVGAARYAQSDYRTGQGENYREVLLTLPVGQVGVSFYPGLVQIQRHLRSTTQGETSIYYDGFLLGRWADDPQLQPNGEYKQRDDEYWMETARIAYNQGNRIDNEGNRVDAPLSGAFVSGHFGGYPNILAWARVQDVKDAEGKNVLMVEEIQSDWHQLGREKGYKPEAKSEAELKQILDEAGYKAEWNGTNWVVTAKDGSGVPNRLAGLGPEKNQFAHDLGQVAAMVLGRRDLFAFAHGLPPPAPFSKSWHELMFRRMLREAVEGGYDAIAWTTGEQQAERYDLSKQVSRIEYAPPEQGPQSGRTAGHLIVFDRAGRDTIMDREATPDELPGIVGKEVAQKLLSEPLGENGYVKLSGLDLKVGGEGMKGFYDKILVDYANKLGKKWGIGARDIDLPLGKITEGATPRRGYTFDTVHSLPINEPMKAGVEAGQISYLFHKDIPQEDLDEHNRAIETLETVIPIAEAREEVLLEVERRFADWQLQERKRLLATLKDERSQRSAILFENENRSKFNLLFPSTRAGARWQLSFFDRYGPFSHMLFNSHVNALKEATSEGFKISDIQELPAEVFNDLRFPRTEMDLDQGKAYDKALFHPEDWQGEFLYGTAIDAEIYDQYVELAKGYETAQAFQSDMEAKYGEPGEGDIEGEKATRFYQEVWEEARKPEPEKPAKVPIQSPLLPSAPTYDYQAKVEAAKDIEDPRLAAKAVTGEISEAEVEQLSAQTEGATTTARETGQTEVAAAEELLASLTAEEQAAVQAGEDLEAAMAERERKAGKPEQLEALERRLKALRTRLLKALEGNAHVAAIMEEQGAWKRILAKEAPVEEAQAYVEGIAFGREVQKIIDEEKARGKLKETRVKLYAEKRAAVAQVKERMKKAEAQRKAARKLKEARKKLIADIMRPPGRSIQFRGYAEQIREIQRGLDPVKRQKQTVYSREQWRKFFDEHPESAKLFTKEELGRIYSVPLSQMSMAELEQIAESLDELRKMGSLMRHMELVARNRHMMALKAQLVAAVMRGEEYQKPVGGVKPTRKILKGLIATWKPNRVLALLDGVFAGLPKGPFSELGQKRFNEAWSAYKKSVRERMEKVTKKAEQLKFTFDRASAKMLKGYEWVGRDFDIDGFRYTNGKIPSLQDVMYWYIGMQNEHTRMALVEDPQAPRGGNNIPMTIIVKGIAKLTENELKLADAIAEDFETNFPRLRDAYIDIFNQDLPGESHYVPMRRREISYETRMDEVAAELTGRAGVRKQYIARGPTYERIDIAAEHQKPIRTDLVNLWVEGVKIQEGFIHQDAIVKEMHSALESDMVKEAINQKYGPELNRWLSRYINDLAQAEAYVSMKGLEKLSRMGRAHATIAWLGFNLLSVAKQSVGTLGYLADLGPLGPAYLLSASAQFAAGQAKGIATGHFLRNTMVDFVRERSELVRNRQISEELENLKRTNVGLYNNIIGKIGKWGMKGLEAMDMTTVCIGWKAVYDKVMRESGRDEPKAIAAADEATLRSQPSARVQDMAQIYRMGEVAKWFTMFTSELNAIWNRLTFDVPLALRRKEFLRAIADLTSIAMAGMVIALVSGALAGGDEEKKRKRLLLGLASEFIESWPIVGNDVFAILSNKQFQSGGVKLMPAFSMGVQTFKEITQGDWDSALQNLIETTSLGVGLPYIGPRRAIKAIVTGDVRALLGWPEEKK